MQATCKQTLYIRHSKRFTSVACQEYLRVTCWMGTPHLYRPLQTLYMQDDRTMQSKTAHAYTPHPRPLRVTTSTPTHPHTHARRAKHDSTCIHPTSTTCKARQHMHTLHIQDPCVSQPLHPHTHARRTILETSRIGEMRPIAPLAPIAPPNDSLPLPPRSPPPPPRLCTLFM